MSNYPIGLLRSRLLTAVGELENSSSTVDYSIVPDHLDRLKARIVDSVQVVCNQYCMPSRKITDQLCVFDRDDDRGHNWIVVTLENDPSAFEICLPYEQLKHWFGDWPNGTA